LGEADAERLLVAALPLVKSESAAIASAAIEALGRAYAQARRGASPALATARSTLEDGLFSALDHPDVEVVKLALSEISDAPDARALARLGMSLDHASPDVRKLAGELLGSAGGPGAQALLRARLTRERDPSVREALTEALMTRPTPSADTSEE
jgi:HEAT repeat protein